MTSPVFLAPTVHVQGKPVPLSSVGEGVEVHFSGPEAHHAQRVQRLLKGRRLDLVDGQGVRVHGEVASAPGEQFTVRVLSACREREAHPSIILVQALGKGSRSDMAVEVCTEVGADGFLPWMSDRAVVKWNKAKQASGRQRWQRVADAAAKQSRRARFPRVEEPLASRALMDLLKGEAEQGNVVLACHEGASAPISRVLAEKKDEIKGARRCFVVVGPEGGFSDREDAELQDLGAQMVLLGPNVLRTSTAGAGAIVALNVGLGNW